LEDGQRLDPFSFRTLCWRQPLSKPGWRLAVWIQQANLHSENFLFSSRLHSSDHLFTRQYARIVKVWVAAIGLDPGLYGTHTVCRTKASRTKNLRAIQLLLGHSKLESTVRYLGIEVDDGLEMAEQNEV